MRFLSTLIVEIEAQHAQKEVREYIETKCFPLGATAVAPKPETTDFYYITLTSLARLTSFYTISVYLGIHLPMHRF